MGNLLTTEGEVPRRWANNSNRFRPNRYNNRHTNQCISSRVVTDDPNGAQWGNLPDSVKHMVALHMRESELMYWVRNGQFERMTRFDLRRAHVNHSYGILAMQRFHLVGAFGPEKYEDDPQSVEAELAAQPDLAEKVQIARAHLECLERAEADLVRVQQNGTPPLRFQAPIFSFRPGYRIQSMSWHMPMWHAMRIAARRLGVDYRKCQFRLEGAPVHPDDSLADLLRSNRIDIHRGDTVTLSVWQNGRVVGA